MLRRTSCLIGCLLALAVVPAVAQGPAIQAGERLRVTMRPDTARPGSSARWDGRLVRLTDDQLVLDPGSGRGELALERARVREVSRFAGRHNRAGKGALIGAITMGSLGLIVDISCGGKEGCDAIGCPSTGMGTVGGALSGAAIGALIGLFVKGDRWEKVTLQEARVAPTAVDGRPGIALQLRF
jgi:hypothetical protein